MHSYTLLLLVDMRDSLYTVENGKLPPKEARLVEVEASEPMDDT